MNVSGMETVKLTINITSIYYIIIIMTSCSLGLPGNWASDQFRPLSGLKSGEVFTHM